MGFCLYGLVSWAMKSNIFLSGKKRCFHKTCRIFSAMPMFVICADPSVTVAILLSKLQIRALADSFDYDPDQEFELLVSTAVSD